MPTYSSHDGTVLAYHLAGQGDPLICVPGGPGRPSGYLGDLGGLAASRRLILLDNRGTGGSAAPADPSGYRADRLIADVEALREHLGLEMIDLLAHSAAADVAVLYAARHPYRIRRLVLTTPSPRAVGLEPTDDEWLAEIRRRSAEPWYEKALAALEAWESGDEREETYLAARPFFYSPWDRTAEAHARSCPPVRAAAKGFYGEVAFDPDATRTAVERLTAPVLVISGEDDPSPTPAQAAAYAAIFPEGRSTSVPGAHFPWVTAPEEFAATVERFLAG
ncbi:alpha/beta fold hydrolase [Actinoallomurus rhizosphaericola]|uniref:alpha/beta fold hydrolase n=1 Tax=Actinoallomurus rhizosphaericola TaxID=2952536 RepID=UPI002092FDC2|nr:alpha/beta hydrolase [Actinoallomurus rhizosphaericola]MCO6000031.1 alpha/beta hydrolase [Actinoallomurus rhizosphaericola]